MNSHKMKAAVYRKYGPPDVIRVTEADRPVPKGGEVLVQVKASSVNAYDWHLLRAKPFFTRFLSGLFKQGDEVYGCLEF